MSIDVSTSCRRQEVRVELVSAKLVCGGVTMLPVCAVCCVLFVVLRQKWVAFVALMGSRVNS